MEPKFESGREWSGSGAEERRSGGRSRASHSQEGASTGPTKRERSERGEYEQEWYHQFLFFAVCKVTLKGPEGR